MEINFYIQGHLKPYELIEMNKQDFEATFVLAFEETSSRAKLFETFQTYISDLIRVIGTNFYIWVDGSFVTTKRNPNDIDIVTFIPDSLFYQFENELIPFSKYGIKEHYGMGLDGYLVVVYAKEHAKNVFTESDEKYWLNQFSYSRRNRQGKKYAKGFIKLSFTQNS